ncbi:Unknown protein, partial [Striga hermonthica]
TRPPIQIGRLRTTESEIIIFLEAKLTSRGSQECTVLIDKASKQQEEIKEWVAPVSHKEKTGTWDIENIPDMVPALRAASSWALARIRQTGNLHEYIKEFEQLACRVRDWSEDALVGAFIGGLRFDLAAEVRLERPDTMHKSMEVARRREDHLVATRRGRVDVRFTNMRCMGLSQAMASARPNVSNRPAVSIVRRLSPEEVKRRREKGLCFKCEEKFTPGHH